MMCKNTHTLVRGKIVKGEETVPKFMDLINLSPYQFKKTYIRPGPTEWHKWVYGGSRNPGL